MIEVQNLSKFYGAKQALHSVGFSIYRGEVVGFLGLNGAGKSTTLRILSCLTLPTSGRVTIDGLDTVRQPRAVRSRIGYLPDTPPLYGEMSVQSYLSFAGQLRGLSAAHAARQVADVSERTGITHVLHERTGHLSHGYKQRVGIAQAIIHRPALLLLDEPTSGLDPAQVFEIRSLVRHLKQDHTILLSSHLLPEVSQICDRILVLHSGKIIAQGTVEELSVHLGTHQVMVRIGGALPRAAELIAQIPHVVRIEQLPAAREQGDLCVTMERDVRPQIARALIEAKFDLFRLDRIQADLETIFLNLTQQGDAEATPTTCA